MAIQRRHKKRSNFALVIMLILAIALGLLLIFWNPTTAKAQDKRPTPEEATLVKAGDVAPDFTLTMFDGSTVKLSALKGKVVLLNFWATWCPPCRAELATVEKEVIERFKGQPFVFLPVSRGEERATVAAFREKMGYTFPMGLDIDKQIYSKYAVTYIPRNFLIDKEGRIVKATVGYTKEEFAELIKEIEKQLKK